MNYVERMWLDITDIWAADAELKGPVDDGTRRALLEKRRAAKSRIARFENDGMPLFARYMRFSQAVPWRLSGFA